MTITNVTTVGRCLDCDEAWIGTDADDHAEAHAEQFDHEVTVRIVIHYHQPEESAT